MVLTAFDYAVVAIILVSAVVGWWRGFMYELFSLIGWIAAYLVSKTFAEGLMPYMPDAIVGAKLRMAAAFATLFVFTMIVGAVVAWGLARLTEHAGLSGVDGKFGAMFGTMRGVLVVIALVWLGGLTDLSQQPFWRDAWTSPYLQQLALQAMDYLP